MKFCVKAICRHKIAKTKKIGLAPSSNVNENYWFIIDLTNRMCFNVVYSFIDNKETEPLSWQLNTTTRIWKCTRCIMQMSCLYASDSFKNLGKDQWRVLVIDKSTYHENAHFDLFFTTISTSKKMFFLSASWKRHWVTHWREQRGRDSYLPRQISQSDCEISSNCGKMISLT